MRTARQIIDDFQKQRKTPGAGILEQHFQVNAFILEVLIDIRDLLQRLQPQTIISTNAPVPTLDPDTREK